MKTSKMNFASMKTALSRTELKKIMAGSTGGGGSPCPPCPGVGPCCGNSFCVPSDFIPGAYECRY